MTSGEAHAPRLRATRRERSEVLPLELFFDLVFVLAITQCTALMAAHPSWTGLGQGLLVLGLLWWSWAGYAWLTSVVDPEEGGVRIAIFATMAALLVGALCVPDAFGDLGRTFAVTYGAVRAGHIALFLVAGRDQPALRSSVAGLAVGTAVGVGLLIGGSFLEGSARIAVWALALALDVIEPLIFGAEGWQLVVRHFAERHGLIVMIALGESIVAIGIGAEGGVTAGVIAGAVLGMALAAAMWWAYFDVVAHVATDRLVHAAEGRERNAMARDSYSYLHFPMVAGIVLVALGMKNTLAHVDEPLGRVPATALVGGVALYLLAHVAFRWRNIHSVNKQRFVLAVLLLALLPFSTTFDALPTLAAVSGLFCALIAFEVVRFADARREIRHHVHDAEAHDL